MPRLWIVGEAVRVGNHRFVATRKGKTVHVSRLPFYEGEPETTLCSRPSTGEVTAVDVLWFHTCERCRRSVEKSFEQAGQR